MSFSGPEKIVDIVLPVFYNIWQIDIFQAFVYFALVLGIVVFLLYLFKIKK